MCPTVASMARGGRGDITNNKPSQCFTSPSPYTHVQGAYGAPTGASEAPTSKILRHLHSRLCADVRQKNTIAAFYRHYRMPLLCFLAHTCAQTAVEMPQIDISSFFRFDTGLAQFEMQPTSSDSFGPSRVPSIRKRCLFRRPARTWVLAGARKVLSNPTSS